MSVGAVPLRAFPRGNPLANKGLLSIHIEPISLCTPLTALTVIAATDMVALFPRRYAETSASSAQIRIVDLPRDHAETIEISMLWYSRVHDDPGLLWLRALIREALNLRSDVAKPRGSVARTSASAGAGRKARKVPGRTGRAKGR